MNGGRQKKRKPWWAFGALAVYVLSKGKAVLTLLKLGKFGGAIASMAVTIGMYALVFKWWFAVGIVAMIFIHELGHVIAAKQKGLPVSAPVFIPFLGALIMMKKHPRDAVTEAYVGMGGPLLGTLGACAAMALGMALKQPVLLVIAQVGFFLNLINLLPIHPLDGGRISAAVTRWLWLVGLVGGLFVIVWLRSILFFVIWAMFAWEMYQKYVQNKGRGKLAQEAYRFEIDTAPLEEAGYTLPGEGHRRDLPFVTYCDLREGKQWVELRWDGLGLQQRVELRQQALIHRVRVARIAYEPKVYPEKVNIEVVIEYEGYTSDEYYDVSSSVRWKFGLAYGGLALSLLYFLYFIHSIGLPLPEVR